MKTAKTISRPEQNRIWEEESGLLDLLSRVHSEVEKFDSAFGFGISPMVSPPVVIDGNTDTPGVGFVVIRSNSLLSKREYCLYSVLKGRMLYGYIGLSSGGMIETLRELKPMKDFRLGTVLLYDWLRDLIKASCDKI